MRAPSDRARPLAGSGVAREEGRASTGQASYVSPQTELGERVSCSFVGVLWGKRFWDQGEDQVSGEKQVLPAASSASGGASQGPAGRTVHHARPRPQHTPGPVPLSRAPFLLGRVLAGGVRAHRMGFRVLPGTHEGFTTEFRTSLDKRPEVNAESTPAHAIAHGHDHRVEEDGGRAERGGGGRGAQGATLHSQQ